MNPDHRAPRADPDEEQRYRAVAALDLAAPDALDRLLDALGDPSWRVQLGACDRLVELPDPARAVPALVAALAPGVAAGRAGAAAAALVRVGAAAVEALGSALASPAAGTRVVAAEVLGEIRDRRAVAPLASRLSDPDENVRAAAAEALGKLGGPDAVAALGVALAVEDPVLRRAAIDALARLRRAPGPGALRALASDRALRRPALRLAGFSLEPEVAGLLVEALQDDTRGVREVALAALGQQRFRRAPGLGPAAEAVRAVAGEDPSVVTLAAAALASDDAPTLAGAISVLEWAGAAEHAPALARTAEDERVRTLASDALAAFGDRLPAALASTVAGLPPGARAAALSALARVGDHAILPLLCEDAASGDDGVRAAAIEALGVLADPAAAPALATLLDHRDPGVATAAAGGLHRLAAVSAQAAAAALAACRGAGALGAARCRLLGRIGTAADEPALRRALSDPDATVRAAAAVALAALASRGVVPERAPELLDALEDLEPEVRAAAAQALGAIGAARRWPQATRALAVALGDEEGAVRAAAALALGAARAAEYAPVLAQLAADPLAPADAVAAAVRALALLGAADAAVLERAVRHPDPEVVKEAVSAAADVPGGAASALLLSAAAHARWDVRRAAARAIGRRAERSLAAPVRRLAAAEDDPLVAEALAEAVEALEGRR